MHNFVLYNVSYFTKWVSVYSETIKMVCVCVCCISDGSLQEFYRAHGRYKSFPYPSLSKQGIFINFCCCHNVYLLFCKCTSVYTINI